MAVLDQAAQGSLEGIGSPRALRSSLAQRRDRKKMAPFVLPLRLACPLSFATCLHLTAARLGPVLLFAHSSLLSLDLLLLVCDTEVLSQ